MVALYISFDFLLINTIYAEQKYKKERAKSTPDKNFLT